MTRPGKSLAGERYDGYHREWSASPGSNDGNAADSFRGKILDRSDTRFLPNSGGRWTIRPALSDGPVELSDSHSIPVSWFVYYKPMSHDGDGREALVTLPSLILQVAQLFRQSRAGRIGHQARAFRGLSGRHDMANEVAPRARQICRIHNPKTGSSVGAKFPTDAAPTELAPISESETTTMSRIQRGEAPPSLLRLLVSPTASWSAAGSEAPRRFRTREKLRIKPNLTRPKALSPRRQIDLVHSAALRMVCDSHWPRT